MCGIGIIRAQQKLVQQAQKTKGFVHLIGGVRALIQTVRDRQRVSSILAHRR
jgi:hypothetical protein